MLSQPTKLKIYSKSSKRLQILYHLECVTVLPTSTFYVQIKLVSEFTPKCEEETVIDIGHEITGIVKILSIRGKWDALKGTEYV